MVTGIYLSSSGMSPNIPQIMETSTSDSSKLQAGIEEKNMTTLDDLSPFSISKPAHLPIKEMCSSSGMLIEEDRTISLSNLPAISGLPFRIRSASLSALTELCTLCFDEGGEVYEAASNFPNIFFLMHKWFTTSDALAHNFRRLFETGRPAHKAECLSILASVQLGPSNQELQPSYRPTSVVMSRKHDDFNGNPGARSPSLNRAGTNRTNSVLIPRPACIGVEEDSFFFQQYRGMVSTANDFSVGNSAGDSASAVRGPTERRKSEGCSSYCGDTCPHNKKTLCDIYKFRRSICHAVRYWIKQFPVHFDLDMKLSGIIKDWQRSLAADGSNLSELAVLLDLGCLPSYDWIRNISIRDTSVKHCRKVSLVFNHLEPSDLAKHLTYLEHRIMRRISFQDYKQYAVTGSLNDNPRLERSVNLFNGLTQWVQCMVLSRSTPQQRAEVMVKLIDVTKKLKELRNFNSLMAVVGGLSHSSLARLTQTTSRVPQDSQRTLIEFTDFLSSSANFSNYRKALQECKGFKIPILGVHMKDLISLHVALSDSVEGGLINFRKMVQLSLIFQELQELQNANPPPGANMDLVNTLRVSLELAHTEDEIYELSLAREPKDSYSPTVSPTKSALSGEWPAASSFQVNQSRPCIPSSSDHPSYHDSNSLGCYSLSKTSTSMSEDSDTILVTERKKIVVEKVNGETDAVFGQLKQELAKVMPPSSPSPAVDRNDSNESSYNRTSAEVDSHVPHDFQEANSFRPCICAHCNGLLWGPLRQGYKCRECGLTAHKLCIEVVKSVCRPKSMIAASFPAESSPGSSIRTGFRRRKKLSSQSDIDNLESGIVAMDCSCDHNCQSPCSRRSSVNSIRQTLPSCDGQIPLRTQGTNSIASKFPAQRAKHSTYDTETESSQVPIVRSGQLFRGSKRRSLIATCSSSVPSPATATKSSPIPIRQRKCSLSFTSPCRSYPGDDPSSKTQSIASLPTPFGESKLKISDPFHYPAPVRKTPCICHGHN